MTIGLYTPDRELESNVPREFDYILWVSRSPNRDHVLFDIIRSWFMDPRSNAQRMYPWQLNRKHTAKIYLERE